MRFREIKLRKDPACPICGPEPSIHELIDYNQFCGVGASTEEPVDAAWEISPIEVRDRLDSGDPLRIIDVRSPEEWEICHIAGAALVPLPELANRLDEIPRDEMIVVHCKSGTRSAKAQKLLRDHGYTNIKNMTGGILAWADQVDSGMAKY
jgi:adenylyltransferase/sulfurtransferase